MEQELKNKLDSYFKEIEKLTEEASNPIVVKNLYELIAQAELLNNLLCDSIDIDEYTNNIVMLQAYRTREDLFLFNLLSKVMKSNPEKTWIAIFNYLRNTNFE